jgi:hypothetical protein
MVFYFLYTFLYFQIFVSLVNGRPGINRPSSVLLVRFLLYRDEMIQILTLFLSQVSYSVFYMRYCRIAHPMY